MADLRRKLGDFGEQAAAAHLLRRGLRIVARKWRCATGELDLVAHEGATLVFVEVRTRRGGLAGSAEESVGRSKQAKLIALAYAYLEANAVGAATPWRIDVVAVDVGAGGRITRLNHLRDAIEE